MQHDLTFRSQLNEKNRSVLFVVPRVILLVSSIIWKTATGVSLKCPQSRIRSPWALWSADDMVARRKHFIYGNNNVKM